MNPPAPAQRTISCAVEAEGKGVHSGKPVRLRLEPAAPDSGIVFVREDMPGAPEVPARPENVSYAALQRMTVLERPLANGEKARVGMIEHLLSACAGLGVWNLRVVLDGYECPIFDGSAKEYVELLRGAGIADQGAPQRRWRLTKPVAILRDNAEIIAIPAERMRCTYFGEFRHAGIPDQQATIDLDRDDYAALVAPARTFCFHHEIEPLLKAGLIQGGSLDCAIVLKDGKPANGDYRIDNELARHKLLDLIGDLAILGAPVAAMISARASGHLLHQEFVRELLKEIEG